MKLKELKESLSKFPPDLDDSEVVIFFKKSLNAKLEYDFLSFTGHVTEPFCVILGSHNAIKELVDKKMAIPGAKLKFIP